MSGVEMVEVSKRYGAVRALDGLSLSVPDGEFVSLLGPSGGGKTTTLRLLAGFDSPDSGTIAIGGRLMASIPAHARETATVWQNYALFPHMTIGENVAYGLKQLGMPRAEIDRRVREALDLIALPGVERRHPHELSGGQQQRIALARALAVVPGVLLLDEPLGALDVSLRTQMQRELRALQRRLGITFIYVTHDQDEALSMSDRVAVLRAGRIEQIGTPRDLYERPETTFVARFLGEGNVLRGTVEAVAGGTATVLAAGSPVRMPAADLRPGDAVDVLIRPERLRLAAELGNGTAACWTVRVESVRYRGATTSVTVRLSDATVLVAESPSDAVTGLREGETTTASTEREHLWAIPRVTDAP